MVRPCRTHRVLAADLCPAQRIFVLWPKDGQYYAASVDRVAGPKVRVSYEVEFSFEVLDLSLETHRNRILVDRDCALPASKKKEQRGKEKKERKGKEKKERKVKEKKVAAKRKREGGAATKDLKSGRGQAAKAAKLKETGCITFKQMVEYLSQGRIYKEKWRRGCPKATQLELVSLVWERTRRLYKGNTWRKGGCDLYSWCPAKRVEGHGPDAIRVAMHARPFVDPGLLGFLMKNGQPVPISVHGQFCSTQQMQPDAIKRFFDGIVKQVRKQGFEIGTSFGAPAEPTRKEWQKIIAIGGVSGLEKKQVGRLRQKPNLEWYIDKRRKHEEKGLHTKKPKEVRGTGPSVTIFMHPGKAEIKVDGDIKVQASVTNKGDRRYQQFARHAEYIDFDHGQEVQKKAEHGMLLWAEHAGPGRVKFADHTVKPKNKYGKPKYVIEPLRDCRLPDTFQIRDNDPAVLGAWNYTLCRQSCSRELGNLIEGSIILFVSTVNKRMVLDTCFVVGEFVNVSA